MKKNTIKPEEYISIKMSTDDEVGIPISKEGFKDSFAQALLKLASINVPNPEINQFMPKELYWDDVMSFLEILLQKGILSLQYNQERNPVEVLVLEQD